MKPRALLQADHSPQALAQHWTSLDAVPTVCWIVVHFVYKGSNTSMIAMKSEDEELDEYITLYFLYCGLDSLLSKRSV